MKTMFILMSHEMTEVQYEDARNNYHIERFVKLPIDIWSQIPPESENISIYLEDLKNEILSQYAKNDCLMVQGDFGATVEMVHFAFKVGLIPVYSTTKRVAKDIIDGDTITTLRIFAHVRFRKYTKGQ